MKSELTKPQMAKEIRRLTQKNKQLESPQGKLIVKLEKENERKDRKIEHLTTRLGQARDEIHELDLRLEKYE